MFQVIHKQQQVIREQSKVIQTLGEEFEHFNSKEFVDRLSKLKKEKDKHEVSLSTSLQDLLLVNLVPAKEQRILISLVTLVTIKIF